MKRTLATLLLTYTLCAAPSAAQTAAPKPKTPRAKDAAAAGAQPAPAEDEVGRLLDRYVLALGGAGLPAVRTRIMRGGVDMSLSPLPGTFESYEKAPKKSLIVVNAPSGQFLHASDDGRTWVKTPFAGATAAGVVGGDLVRQAGGAFRWRNVFSSARVKGRAFVEGRETVVLAATPVGGGPLLMHFDAETGLLRKQEFVRVGGGKETDLRAIYIDSYATVDGLKAPALFRHVYPQFTMTFRVSEVKHNVPISDALFADPNGR